MDYCIPRRTNSPKGDILDSAEYTPPRPRPHPRPRPRPRLEPRDHSIGRSSCRIFVKFGRKVYHAEIKVPIDFGVGGAPVAMATMLFVKNFSIA